MAAAASSVSAGTMIKQTALIRTGDLTRRDGDGGK